MYTTYVVCLVSGMWGSMVCGVEVGGMWREVVCGDKWYVGFYLFIVDPTVLGLSPFDQMT